MYQQPNFERLEDLYENLKRIAISHIFENDKIKEEKDNKSSPVQLAFKPGLEARLGDVPHHVFFYRMYDTDHYRAFCGGSIITEKRVLTASHCFLTNRKRPLFPQNSIKVVAASLMTYIQKSDTDNSQWRNIVRIYTQRFYRYPSFNLAIVEVDEAWTFNDKVTKIPYATENKDYDGVCHTVGVRPTKSWALNKELCFEPQRIVKRSECEQSMYRSCRLFYCTMYYREGGYDETDGAGLICHGTGDPAEDPKVGLLVGVTSLVNNKLPTLHNKVGLFHEWITAGSCVMRSENFLLLTFLILL